MKCNLAKTLIDIESRLEEMTIPCLSKKHQLFEPKTAFKKKKNPKIFFINFIPQFHERRACTQTSKKMAPDQEQNINERYFNMSNKLLNDINKQWST